MGMLGASNKELLYTILGFSVCCGGGNLMVERDSLIATFALAYLCGAGGGKPKSNLRVIMAFSLPVP